MCRLVCACVVRNPPKTYFLATRPISCMEVSSLILVLRCSSFASFSSLAIIPLRMKDLPDESVFKNYYFFYFLTKTYVVGTQKTCLRKYLQICPYLNICLLACMFVPCLICVLSSLWCPRLVCDCDCCISTGHIIWVGKYFFLINQNICCGYSKEQSQ